MVTERLLAQQHPHSCVFEHESDTLPGIAGIHGDVSAAGLKHREQSNHHLQRACHANSHPHFRPDTQVPQMPGELIGTLLEFPIGQLLVLKHERHGIGHLGGPLADQLMHALGSSAIHPGLRAISARLIGASYRVSFQCLKQRCGGWLG